MLPPESRSDFLTHVDVRRWADRGTVLNVDVALSALPRWLETVGTVAETTDCVRMQAVFSLDPKKQVLLDLAFSGEVALECQRCLEPMVWSFQEQVFLRIARDEESLIGTAQQEDYVLTDAEGYLNLLDVLEDELLLSLPLVAMHADRALCGKVVEDFVEDVVEDCVEKPAGPAVLPAERSTEKVRPFAQLAQLLANKTADK